VNLLTEATEKNDKKLESMKKEAGINGHSPLNLFQFNSKEPKSERI